jgi:hypothetical protein
MSTIEASIEAINIPRVVLESVDHLPLYGSAGSGELPPGCLVVAMVAPVTQSRAPPLWRSM